MRRHRAAQTTVGKRHKNAALFFFLMIGLGLGCAGLVGMLGNSMSLGSAILCGLVPGAVSLGLARWYFESGLRRRIWLGYGVLLLCAGLLAGILLRRHVDEWPPALTFLILWIVVMPIAIAGEAEKKRGARKNHARALAALSRKQKN